MNRTRHMTAVVGSLLILCTGALAWGAPSLRQKTAAEMQREVALRVKASIVSNQVNVDQATHTKTRTVTVKILAIKANKTAFQSALKKGQLVQFQKSCELKKDKSHNPNELSRHCKGKWAAIPAAFLKSKGSKINVSLRILRSASRIVFATVSPTSPETRVIKGTAVLR